MRFAIALLLVAVVAGCSSAGEEADHSPPDEVEVLIDDWYAANERGDGSVLDLYVPDGYHLYGDTRYEYDEIVDHLSGDAMLGHEWVTEPLLITEGDDGRYVVVRGMEIASPNWSTSSALLFEIVTTPEGDLRIAQTAWFAETE